MFVPWERVLTYRDTDAAFRLWWDTPAFLNFVHQGATRFWTKLEFLTGLAVLLAKANGTYDLPPVTQAVGRLLGRVAQAKAFVLAAEASYTPVDEGRGGVAPGKDISYAQRIMAGELYPQAVQEVKLLAGEGSSNCPPPAASCSTPSSGRCCAPTSARPPPPRTPASSSSSSPGTPSAPSSPDGTEQYERFYHGAPHVYLMQQAWEGGAACCEQLVRTCLDGYGLTADSTAPAAGAR